MNDEADFIVLAAGAKMGASPYRRVRRRLRALCDVRQLWHVCCKVLVYLPNALACRGVTRGRRAGVSESEDPYVGMSDEPTLSGTVPPSRGLFCQFISWPQAEASEETELRRRRREERSEQKEGWR